MVIAECHQGVNDILDYTVSFATWLTDISDAISTVSWTVPGDLTASNASNTTSTATNWLTGGKPGQRYVITCTIVTQASPARTKEVSFGLKIEGRP